MVVLEIGHRSSGRCWEIHSIDRFIFFSGMFLFWEIQEFPGFFSMLMSFSRRSAKAGSSMKMPVSVFRWMDRGSKLNDPT